MGLAVSKPVEFSDMKKLFLAAMLGAVTMTAAPAIAQNPNREYNRDVRQADREYKRNVRQADDRRDVREARREYREDVRDARKDRKQAVRDWRQYRQYDYNRLPQGQRAYYANDYYRDGRYYQERRLTRNERIYRGQDNRYYCRRSDGTTGLIVGGAVGGLLGNTIVSGGSRTLATIIGAGAGALLGREVDRGGVRCR